MQVLIVKTSSMGDVIHTLPALTDAVSINQTICFDWVVEENFVEIPRWHPAVRCVIPVSLRRWRKNWFSQSTRKEWSQFKARLQKSYYDAIIDAQGLIKSAIFVTRVARGEKHGFDYSSAREPIASWFYQKRYSLHLQQHAVERIRQLFSFSLSYPVFRKVGDYAIRKHFSYQKFSKTHLIFLHATTKRSKQWPETYWRMLIRFVYEAGYHVQLPWGTREEQLRSYRLAKGFKIAQVLPLLSLEEIARKIALARAVVCVDTGLGHLAAALDRPSLALYGPTDPNRVGLYGRCQQTLRAIDGNMKNLSANQVWKKLQIMLYLTE